MGKELWGGRGEGVKSYVLHWHAAASKRLAVEFAGLVLVIAVEFAPNRVPPKIVHGA